MANKRGHFIVFEGIDGCGKSTQISLLEQHLKSKGIKVYKTCEPTSSVIGGAIRDTLAGAVKRTSAELAALFLADRIGHCQSPINGIKKYLSEGVTVICDRYYYSSFAYQGLDSDIDWVMSSNLNCPDIIKPDLCIFLDVDAESCKQRVDRNRLHLEIFEQSASQLSGIRNKFFEVFARLEDTEHIEAINAARSIDEVAKDIAELADSII